jgi:hypothetical protein
MPRALFVRNNEAKARLRVVVDFPDRGVCRTGLVSWDARS